MIDIPETMNVFYPSSWSHGADLFSSSNSTGRPGSSIGMTRPTLKSTLARPQLTCAASRIEFIRGIEEPTIPDVRLTRSRDGASGTATFVFENPSIFEASGELGDITGLFMEDDEGLLTTVDVQAKFINGKPSKIEAKYVMRSAFEWDRFMRFMERYAEDKGLGFAKKS